MTEEILPSDEDGQVEEPVINTNPKLRWYVVQAFSGYEGRVQKTLVEHIEIQGLHEKFGQILVPTEEVVEMRAGQKRKSSRKFFPGYVLVQMEMDVEAWHLVKSVPRVLGFIGGTSDRPAPISQKEADRILQRLEDTDKPRPKHYLNQEKWFELLMGHLLTSTAWLKNLITRKIALKYQF